MKKHPLSAICLSSALLLAACGKDGAAIQNKIAAPAVSAEITDGRVSEFSSRAHVAEARPQRADDRAEAIAEAVTALSEIEDVSVAMSGNTAIIGIKILQELDDAGITELKRRVEKAAKNADAALEHAAITASPELFDKINKMSGRADKKTPEEEHKAEEQDNDALIRIAPLP